MNSDTPPCPDCGTALHVGRDKADDIDHIYHYCGQRWSR